MLRTSLAVIGLATAVTAQDFVFPLGYGNASGPPSSSYPAARAKDQNGNGMIENEEIHAFCTTLPTTASSGTNFMTDARYVTENGNIVFYFTDSEDGQVLRCEDANHNGVIDPSEATVFFRFGLSTSNGPLYTPDAVAVYRDTVAGETRVYASLVNPAPSSLGFSSGIHRLVDTNGDGDAMDPGEQSVFVDGTLNLTVPGNSGPVPVPDDFWIQLRVLPGGKVIAYASGSSVAGTLIPNSNPPAYTYTVQPEENCWYGFTDNNGTAVPEVWFNASTLNDLPVHPDFDDPRIPYTATFPNWDVQSATVPGTRVCYARFCDVVAGGGPAGEDLYYLASSYRTTNEGDTNLNGQSISGLVYRVVDSNDNQLIDTGEISLYCNFSGQTHAGVAAITFDDHLGNAQPSINGRTWAYSTTSSGSVNILWENGGTNDGVIALVDANNNGVIDQGEANMPYATPQGATYLPPFHPSFGPYFTSMCGVGDFEMPGPFGPGATVFGDSCPLASTGEKAVMETWNGAPSVGTTTLEVGCIRGLPGLPAFLMGSHVVAATPLNLGPLGLGSACNSYLSNPVPVAVTTGDGNGTHNFNLQIPNDPNLVGVNISFQMALLDPVVTTPVTYVTSNALTLTVQP